MHSGMQHDGFRLKNEKGHLGKIWMPHMYSVLRINCQIMILIHVIVEGNMENSGGICKIL